MILQTLAFQKTVLNFNHPLTSKPGRNGQDRRVLRNEFEGVGSGTMLVGLLILRSYEYLSKQIEAEFTMTHQYYKPLPLANLHGANPHSGYGFAKG
jgi:hypothetical protein